MRDEGKTKEDFGELSRAELINELGGMRQRIAELEAVDIERKRVEKELRESQERYRALFEQAADSIVLIDAETGALVEFNDRAHENLGYTREEFQKLKVPDFEVIESAEEVAKHIEKIIKEGADTFETQHRTKDGEIRDILVSSRAISIAGRHFVQSTWRDITERKRAEEIIRQLAYHDDLTGLPNRRLFDDRLTLELVHAQRNQQRLAVMLLDLDHFKHVNDRLGHSVGDLLLQAVGERLTSLLRKSDTVARMGGDEFMLLLPEITSGEDVVKIAAKILEAFREPFAFGDPQSLGLRTKGHELHITTSIGIAMYPEDDEDGDTLMKHADIAMYSAKDQGRDNYQRYTLVPNMWVRSCHFSGFCPATND